MIEYEILVRKLQLKKYPEGGYYRETYRSKSTAELANIGLRNFSTCIYYLLTADNFSTFHRVTQDEIWNFYACNPVHLHLIDNEGKYRRVFIGNNFEQDQVPQFVIPAGCWFAANVELNYALVGCTVSPGFDFRDFEMAERKTLINKFPEHSEIITRFTR